MKHFWRQKLEQQKNPAIKNHKHFTNWREYFNIKSQNYFFNMLMLLYTKVFPIQKYL